MINSFRPNRISLIKRSISLWSKAIIISIYCEIFELSQLIQWIKSNDIPTRIEFVIFVVESNEWNHITYPMNYLRNIAIKRTRTTHYIILDMDEWITNSLEKEILKIPRSILDNPFNVIIIPLVILNDIKITKRCCTYEDCLFLYDTSD